MHALLGAVELEDSYAENIVNIILPVSFLFIADFGIDENRFSKTLNFMAFHEFINIT